MGELGGLVAVVTGASSGIGKAVALGLAEQGATLCLAGRNLELLEAVAERARKMGSYVRHYRTDLIVDDDISQLATYIGQEIGFVDILIHAAAVIALGPVENAPVCDFDLQYRTNVRAPYLLTQTLLPMMKPRCGQIVFINSSTGLGATVNSSQYSASKHALKAMADSLRQEVNKYGIRVSSIFPGRTATPMQARVHQIERKDYQQELLLQPEDVAAVAIRTLTLPRTAEVTDISIRPLVKSY